LIPTGGSIYFASDWHELALDIRGCLMGTNCFDIPGSDYDANLQPTMTPKELQVQHEKDEKRFIDIRKNSSKPVTETTEKWLASIPFDGVMTERDIVCETQWRSVYRLVLIRNNQTPHE
jgi:tRNA G46 methylase TrmB